MQLVKKLISLFFIWLFRTNQSVFSHFLVDSLHHEEIILVNSHIHESWEIHEHITKSLESCNDSNCTIDCKNIEESKIVSHCRNKWLWIDNHYYLNNPTSYKLSFDNLGHEDLKKSFIFHYSSVSTEELMPRIWPVVRII